MGRTKKRRNTWMWEREGQSCCAICWPYTAYTRELMRPVERIQKWMLPYFFLRMHFLFSKTKMCQHHIQRQTKTNSGHKSRPFVTNTIWVKKFAIDLTCMAPGGYCKQPFIYHRVKLIFSSQCRAEQRAQYNLPTCKSVCCRLLHFNMLVERIWNRY